MPHDPNLQSCYLPCDKLMAALPYFAHPQRGPVMPCAEELSEPSDEGGAVTAGIGMLTLPLLVLAPYPIELMLAFEQLGQASF